MAEIRVPRLEQQTQTRIKNVPIAVTPEGFWCCPSPAVFQKTIKPQNPPTKPKSIPQTLNPPLPKNHSSVTHRKPSTTSSRACSLTPQKPSTTSSSSIPKNPSTTSLSRVTDEQNNAPAVNLNPPPSQARKVTIEFGEAGTSDLKVILLGKQGITVKLSVHRSVVAEHSRFFAGKILDEQLVFPCIEIDNCEDVEMYAEAIGLMYCKDLKHRLMKQTVSRVLRILKVGQQLGYTTCIQCCLEYLEVVPWVGEEEEERVISSVMHLHGSSIEVGPVLKRVVASHASTPPPNDTLSHILESVLQSKDEKARREMKPVVLKLLRENNGLENSQNKTLYALCRTSLDSLLSLFKRAVADPEFPDKQKMISLEADNLLWLLDILFEGRRADEFAVMWVGERELAGLHGRVSVVVRCHVSMVTARLFVGMGRGEVLPSKDTRCLLLETWLQPLMDDYGWLQHACRSFDRMVVEEGIGRTVLTLPMEDQQRVLMCWLGRFVEAGDSCPNLVRAFEVWWRRTFVRPYGSFRQPEGGMMVEAPPTVGS